MAERVRTALRWSWAYMRRAPGAFVWLGILLLTTVLIRSVSPTTADHILERRSTNIHYLVQSPVRVLISSALYIAGGGWFFYFVLYNLFHVPVERRLGTGRWLTVAVIAHVGATYLSEGVLLWAIDHGQAPQSARYTLDYGVSYALAGVQGVLVYLLARPWRYLYLGGLLLFYGLGVVAQRDFTSIGHFSAVLLGLACYPVTRGRVATEWDPAEWARALYRRVRGRAVGGSPADGG